MRWLPLLLLALVSTLAILVLWFVNRHPLDQPLPNWLAEPPNSVQEHWGARAAWASTEWGSPHRDGPDANMPDKAFWHEGRLHVRA